MKVLQVLYVKKLSGESFNNTMGWNMYNELIHTTKYEYINSDPTSKLGNCFIVNLKGNEISNKMELFSILQKEYTLPDADSWEGITDWLTDLSWIETDNFQ